MTQNDKLDILRRDLAEFWKANGMAEVILHNWDNNDMGLLQMMKIIKNEEDGKDWLCLSFSSSGKKLCPHCSKGEK